MADFEGKIGKREIAQGVLGSNSLIITLDDNQLVKKYKILNEDDSSEINISYPKEAYNQNSEISLIQEFLSIFTRKLDAP